ncbi:hypothetical protein GY45DRAFT_40546 [Cubamyces sp. BRFM 1775]|nr:hypothetical protein GY45DRAFT_40546 [Cubamyces sp. BRFM 1775]
MTQVPEDIVHDGIAELLTLLDLAMKPTPAGDSAGSSSCSKFRTDTLAMRGVHRVVRTRKQIPLIMTGERRHMEVVVCFIYCRRNSCKRTSVI